VNKRTGDRDIDISHESLILLLKKLKQWADEEAKSVGWYQRAVDNAVRGANAWRGADLKLALKHLESGAWNATWAGRLPNRGAEFARVKDYLERGQAEEAAKVEKAERDRAKELADAQALAEAERKAKVAAEALSAARKRANRLLLGVGAVAMVMLVLFLVGQVQQKRALQVQQDLQERLVEAAKTGARVNPKDGLNYVLIPAGKFRMSCSPGDADCTDRESPAHEVHISKSFWLGQN
jgi:formylglycine-generating enzyme required for sulfatase activity